MLQKFRITPLHEQPNRDDLLEEQLDPHSNADATEDKSTDVGDAPFTPPRRVKITLKDLERLGFTENCPKCALYQSRQTIRAQNAHHSEACRQSIYKKLTEEGSRK